VRNVYRLFTDYGEETLDMVGSKLMWGYWIFVSVLVNSVIFYHGGF